MEEPNEEIAYIIIDIVDCAERRNDSLEIRAYGCCLLTVARWRRKQKQANKYEIRIRIHTDTHVRATTLAQ